VPALAALVPEPHKVELGKPDIVVLVEACKGVATIALVKDYYGLLKYNQRLLSMNEEERQAERARCMPPPVEADDTKDTKKEAEEKEEKEEKKEEAKE
jgi:tRNA acetyltransferase TAN1